jgi:hypothetical protein
MESMWLSKAHERHQKLEIPLDKLIESYYLVCSVLGSDWISEEEHKLKAGDRTVSDAHPLYRHITSPTDTSLVFVCELAEYLKVFSQDPAIPTIIADLKSSKFESTVFELAMAYRWRDAGSVVVLRPSTPKGEADFDARIQGKTFVVEVSGFPDDIFVQPKFRVPMIIDQAVKVTIKRAVPVAVKMTLTSFPPGNSEEAIRHAVTGACREFMAANGASVTKEIDFGRIEIEAITDQTENNPMTRDEYKRIVDARDHDWDVFQRAVRRRVPPGIPVYRVTFDEEETETARIFLRLPSGKEDPYQRILKKIRKEAAQLRGISDPRVVLLDVSAATPDVFNLHLGQIRDELLNLMRSTPELTCVWVLTRRWSTAFRFKYCGIYVANPESHFQIPQSFLRSWLIREWKWDFVGGREFVSCGEEEDMRRYADRAE